MNPLRIVQLDLRAPLVYRKAEDLSPFTHTGLPEDSLFCFDLSPDQHLSIEPAEDHYLGPVLFAGTLPLDPDTLAGPPLIELPQGTYMFAQVRELLGREGFIWLATEVQKEGLWQRLTLERRLYLRYLVEEGKTITQVFRPYRA
ncbi:MAG: hypothetical protein LBU25_11735 [Treponema sp.]|jgi:hypothetical protein|nr:hypothetical protein [Treponema sp.]